MLSWSTHDRSGIAKMISEAVATFGLVSVILSCIMHRQEAIPFAVAAYIGSAYWFTASTSFANPAVTLARSLPNTFSGIRLTDVPGFILAQIVGGLLAMLLFGWIYSEKSHKTNL